MQAELDGKITPMQLVVVAMIGGMLAFAVMTLFVSPRMEHDPALARPLLAALGGMGVMELVAYLVLRQVTLAGLRGRADAGQPQAELDGRILGAWQTLTLIRSAMLEAIGLFGIVIVLLTGRWAWFAVPAAAIAFLVAGFPSRGQLESLSTRITGANPYAT
jgi:hypothetical protein